MTDNTLHQIYFLKSINEIRKEESKNSTKKNDYCPATEIRKNHCKEINCNNDYEQLLCPVN